MVRNNSIIGVDTPITGNIRSRVGRLVQVEKKMKRIELKIFSGDIYFPEEMDKISRHSNILIPLRTVKKTHTLIEGRIERRYERENNDDNEN